MMTSLGVITAQNIDIFLVKRKKKLGVIIFRFGFYIKKLTKPTL